MTDTVFMCAYCGEPNDLVFDVSGGARQQYIEDCQVCCRPNALLVTLDDDGEIVVTARREDQ